MKLSMLNKTLLVLKIPIAMIDKRQQWNRDCFLQLCIYHKSIGNHKCIYIHKTDAKDGALVAKQKIAEAKFYKEARDVLLSWFLVLPKEWV